MNGLRNVLTLIELIARATTFTLAAAVLARYLGG